MALPPPNLASNAIMWPWFLLVSAAELVLGVVVGTLAKPFDPARKSVLWLNHLLWGRLLFLLGPLWTAERRIPELGPGPYVIVSNHASLIDIPLNVGLPLPIRIGARPGLFRVPLMGWFMRFSGHICVESGSKEAIEATMQACRAAIQDGISILIFPEGTRSDDGSIGSFHKGAFHLARELGVPILPVVVDGTGQALPKGSVGLVKGFCRFRMHVLEPIDPSTLSARALSRRVQDRMTAELDHMRRLPVRVPSEQPTS